MRHSKSPIPKKLSLSLLVLVALVLGGCFDFMGEKIESDAVGSNGGADDAGAGTDVVQVTLSGNVGAVSNSSIIIRTADNATVWTGNSDLSVYSVAVSLSAADFPLVLQATNGSDLISGFSPEFEMPDVSRTTENAMSFQSLAGCIARWIVGELANICAGQSRI